MSTEIIKRPSQDLLTLDEAAEIRDLEARFHVATRQRELLEEYIGKRLKPGKHYYTVGNSDKPGLAKEGAELICLPHALKPQYSILSGPEQPPDNDTPYQITVLCRLMKGDHFEGEGIGSASSHTTTKTGERIVRQRDVGLRHNATLKMAQKSGYIAATLNATAASEFFTQDMEDAESAPPHSNQQAKPDTQYYCAEHKAHWFKTPKMRAYAHPIGDTGKWCNMPKDAPKPVPQVVDVSQGQDITEEIFGDDPDAPSAPAPRPAAPVQATPPSQGTAALPEPPSVSNVGALFTYGRSIGFSGRIGIFKALGIQSEQALGTADDLQAAAAKLREAAQAGQAS